MLSIRTFNALGTTLFSDINEHSKIPKVQKTGVVVCKSSRKV